MSPSTPPLIEASIPEIELLHRGKVRDLFALSGGEQAADGLLLVATDRVSAFDVVLPDPLPDKGEVLNRISEFWFRHFESTTRHHLITTDFSQMPAPLPDHPELRGRATFCRRVKPLMAEFVVRGYITGSAWKDYKRSGSVCGLPLPEGMQEAQPFPEPLFTPSTKAPLGAHDENISFDQLCDVIGGDKAEQARDLVMRLYKEAAAYTDERGILLADTKIELGEDEQGILVIDELFTPDSSRFWPKDQWKVGGSPPSYDKQIVRNALEKTDWDKKPPGPRLDQAVLDKARAAYHEIFHRLTGHELHAAANTGEQS